MPRYARRANRDLDGLPESLRKKARNLCERLDAEPALGKKLKGPLDGLRSVRLGRSHRVIYSIDAAGVVVMTIVARKDAY